jgi:hypothetical protein
MSLSRLLRSQRGLFAGRTQGREEQRAMKILVPALVTLSLAAGLAVPAQAHSETDGRWVYSKKKDDGYDYAKRDRRYSREYIADKRPIGSAEWWRQMDREDRGGRGRP